MNTEHRGRQTADGIRIYDPSDFAGMHAAGRLAATILDEIAAHVDVGQTTGELDRLIQKMVEDAGATSATIGYKGYQHASCISVNHVVCHGIPGAPIPKQSKLSKDLEKRRDSDALKDGDIVNIDVTVIVDGWFGDTSRMYTAGKASAPARKLIDITHDALMLGIAAVKPGNTFGDIGHAIQTFVEGKGKRRRQGFLRAWAGACVHAPPNVVHYGRPGTEAVLEPGMFFTIEPMVNMGRPETKTLTTIGRR